MKTKLYGMEKQKINSLTKEDVWGDFDIIDTMKMVAPGKVVSRNKEICKIWGDILPYKSVTVVCEKEEEEEVRFWLEYVHGGDCISRRKVLEDNKIAIRSDYQCW